MVRIPSRDAESDGDIDSTMTPMIDVVFLLLIFFVWTAGTQIVEYMLPGQLSAETGNLPANLDNPPPEQDFDKVVIRLRWDGGLPDWSVNDQPLETIEEVATMLQSLAGIKPDAPLVIHPDSPVPLGYVIELFDESRLAGFSKVSFAVNQE